MPPILGKRPFTQTTPEPVLEPISASSIIVLHPGSSWLRVGRASDSVPASVPHCVARRHKRPGEQETRSDAWLWRPEVTHGDAKSLQKAGLRAAEDALRTRPTQNGDARQYTTHKQLHVMNSETDGELTVIPSPRTWTNTHMKSDYIVGEDALYLSPDNCYDVHWPLRRGQWNCHDGPGGTLSAACHDLEIIWSEAIRKKLEIDTKGLSGYRAVLLIPDIYNRGLVREMMNILLNKLNFSAAFAVQESVCATFGAGVASACVLDVGDQKTAVCCVEDGLSIPASRLVQDFGGSDVTRCMLGLLTKAGFPYRDCDLARQFDALFLQELKETLCHLEHDISGIGEHLMQVKTPSEMIVKYRLNFGDDVVLAPLSLFFPDMFGMYSTGLWRTHSAGEGHPDDPHDDHYLRQTQSRQEAAAKASAAKKKEKQETECREEIVDVELDDDDEEGDAREVRGAGRAGEREEEPITLGSSLLGIDQAVLQSIDKCECDEMKRRMYSTIVVVGGGVALFREADSWIKYAVWTQIPAAFRSQLETMDVLTEPKEYDPRLTAWKGGAIMSMLDTTQELWLRGSEWRAHGVRALRERAPFVW